jgi:hypothetical protein
MDMHFNWLRDCKAQDQLRINWQPGKTNLADCFMKHHLLAHHVSVRSQFLTRVKYLAEAQRRQQEQGQTNPKSAKVD